MSSRRPPASARTRGFTLLEVMCALAILGLLTGTITVMCHQATERGWEALDLRELREAADTVFRRVLYEDGARQWTDGQTGTLDYYYGDFAQLRGPARDRWQSYGMEYRRRARTVAGSSTESQSDPLFGQGLSSGTSRSSRSGTGTSGTGTSGTGTSGTGTTGSGTEEDSGSEMVWQITLTFYRVEERDKPLMVLQTFLPPQVGETTGASGTSSGTPR